MAPPESQIHLEFCEAAKEGHHTARLKYLLGQGADINAKDQADLTALYHAAARGDQENTKLLLDFGANVNSRHEVFMSPIWIAALRGHADVVKILLDHNADTSAQGYKCTDGMGTVMHCAFFSGDIATVRCLLEHHAVSRRESSASKVDDHKLERTRLDPKLWKAEKPLVSIVALRKIADSRFKFPVNQPFRVQIMRQLLHCEWHNFRLVRCSPILLAADCCHFDLLRLYWSKTSNMVLDFHVPGQPSVWPPNDTWELVDATSMYMRTPENSNNSAWSCFGFPDLIPRQSESTFLMWAAASLNIRLIDHLLNAGVSVHEEDIAGRMALHYAASPFEDATFSDMDKCVQRLTTHGASISTPTKKVETLLQLLVGPEHAALDPRLSRLYGANLHTNCLRSIIENAVLAPERRNISRIALRYALRHTECPFSSITLLCAYGGASDTVGEGEFILSNRTGQCCTHDPEVEWSSDSEGSMVIRRDGNMHMTPLQVAIKWCANPAVVSALLEHGADPKLLTEHERTSVIFTRSVKQIKEAEHESRKETVLATLGRTGLQSIASLLGLSRQR